MKRFQSPAPRPADVDVPLPVLEQQIADLALQAAYRHQPEPMEVAFAALAFEHPDACTKPADYPAWTPPHLETAS